MAPPPFLAYGLLGAAERTRTSKPVLPATRFPSGATANYHTAADFPGTTIFTLFHRRRPHRKPGNPGTRCGCSLATGVGLEPTREYTPHRFSGPIGCHYRILPYGGESGIRTHESILPHRISRPAPSTARTSLRGEEGETRTRKPLLSDYPISSRAPYHSAHLSKLITNSIVSRAHQIGLMRLKFWISVYEREKAPAAAMPLLALHFSSAGMSNYSLPIQTTGSTRTYTSKNAHDRFRLAIIPITNPA